jgi:hypothetical protein
MDARRELTGRDEWFRMDLPATCQQIQQCCGVTTESLSADTARCANEEELVHAT